MNTIFAGNAVERGDVCGYECDGGSDGKPCHVSVRISGSAADGVALVTMIRDSRRHAEAHGCKLTPTHKRTLAVVVGEVAGDVDFIDESDG